MDSNQNQPSEVKEGGALEAAVKRLEADLVEGATYRYPQDLLPDLRTVLDALAARPPSMERGEAEDDAAREAGQTLYSGGYHDGFLDGYLIGKGEDTYPDEEGEREISMQADSENIADGWANHRDAYLTALAAAPSPAPSAASATDECAGLSCFECGGLDFTGPVCVACNPAPSAVEMAGVERDAARWRAFINCGHIKMQGWAACDTNGDRMSVDERPIGSVHFGAEFWVDDGRDQLPTGATHDQAARKVITAFADDCIAAGLLALATASREKGSRAARELKPAADTSCASMAGVYVASRASLPERGQMWRDLRASGVAITSTWIDEDGPGQTGCNRELWSRIEREVKAAAALILYVEPGDFPLKGALIEVGMAIAAGRPVYVVAPGVELEERSLRPLGSWALHPLVTFTSSVADAVAASMPQTGGEA